MLACPANTLAYPARQAPIRTGAQISINEELVDVEAQARGNGESGLLRGIKWKTWSGFGACSRRKSGENQEYMALLQGT